MNKKNMLKYFKDLREKINKGKLIIFVGAGVSKNVEGMPSWGELVDAMAKYINYDKCSQCANFSDECKEPCVHNCPLSTDEFLKIPQYVYNTSKNEYIRILEEKIKSKEGGETIDAPLSHAIFDLLPAHIITTNYDHLLEDCSNEKRENYDVIIKDSDLLNSEKSKYIIKMHGDIKYPDSIVLKEADYLSYSQNHVLIEMFVKSLLADHTILFLGYSLNDYNIKLMINWINYIRIHNKKLDKKTRMGYIVVDDENINSNQINYLKNNYIEPINICKLTKIHDIPNELTDERGKRLYSFLRFISNPLEEFLIGKSTSFFSNVLSFMKQFSFIDIDNLCYLLSLSAFPITDNSLTLYNDEQFNSLTEFLSAKKAESLELNQLFFDAGIYVIEPNPQSKLNKEYNYFTIPVGRSSLFKNDFYILYLSNKYIELQRKTCESNLNCLESCFYLILVEGYTRNALEKFQSIDFTQLNVSQKISFLFNEQVWETRKLKNFDSKKITDYINGITDIRVRKAFSLYNDIFEGNYQKIYQTNEALEKLKDLYKPQKSHILISGDFLENLYQIRRIAYEQYTFYFKNDLIFKNFSDFKIIFSIYIESIICTNVTRHTENNSNFFRSTNLNNYEINKLDLDILTKCQNFKDFNNLIQKYHLEKFELEENFNSYIVDCFENLIESLCSLKQYNNNSSIPSISINYLILISHIELDSSLKLKLKKITEKLFNDNDFLCFFFSTKFFNIPIRNNSLNNFLNLLPKSNDLNIVEKIMKSPNFNEYYNNSNDFIVRKILGYFINDLEKEKVQEKLYKLIDGFDGREKVMAIRLLYSYITASKYICKIKEFIKDNFNILSSFDIFDFVFNDLLQIDKNMDENLISSTVNLYKKQLKSGIHSYPDPVEEKINIICILYMNDKITNLTQLEEIKNSSPFLQFIFDTDNFDYNRIDLSNYMWENFARSKKFRKTFLVHKDKLIPQIKSKIETGEATDFERMFLYGVLLNEDELYKL